MPLTIHESAVKVEDEPLCDYRLAETFPLFPIECRLGLLVCQCRSRCSLRVGIPDLTIRGKEGNWPLVHSGPLLKTPTAFVICADAPNLALERVIITYLAKTPNEDASGAGPLHASAGCRLRYVILGTNLDWPTRFKIQGRCEVDSSFLGRFSQQPGIEGDATVRNSISVSEQFGLKKSIVENTIAKRLVIDGPCEIHHSVATAGLEFLGSDIHVDSSILLSVISHKPGTSIDFCDVISGRYTDQAKAGTGCISVEPQFTDAKNLDFTLSKKSPCRGKASDGGDLGVTYTPEMIEVIKMAFLLRQQGVIKF
jgi:hypothetical protein